MCAMYTKHYYQVTVPYHIYPCIETGSQIIDIYFSQFHALRHALVMIWDGAKAWGGGVTLITSKYSQISEFRGKVMRLHQTATKSLHLPNPCWSADYEHNLIRAI